MGAAARLASPSPAPYGIAYSKALLQCAQFIKHSRASLVAQWLRVCLPCRGHGFEPWSGKIPHATEQLGP